MRRPNSERPRGGCKFRNGIKVFDQVDFAILTKTSGKISFINLTAKQDGSIIVTPTPGSKNCIWVIETSCQAINFEVRLKTQTYNKNIIIYIVYNLKLAHFEMPDDSQSQLVVTPFTTGDGNGQTLEDIGRVKFLKF